MLAPVDALIVFIDDLLVDSVAEPASPRINAVRRGIEATLADAMKKGIKLGLVSRMIYYNVAVACEIAFDRDFINSFDVVLTSDRSCECWSSRSCIEEALVLLRVKANRAMAMVCNELDLIVATQIGVGSLWRLDCAKQMTSVPPSVVGGGFSKRHRHRELASDASDCYGRFRARIGS